MTSPVWTAGWATVPLPDGVGCDLSGFLARDNPSVGLRDSVFARAIWLSDGGSSFAWVSADVLAVAPATVARVKRSLSVARRAPDRLMITATHTHSAPATIFLANCGTVHRPWLRAFESAVAQAVATARERARAGYTISWSATNVEAVSRNRRRQYAESVAGPDAASSRPHDPTLTTITLRDPHIGKPAAALVHFACHPVIFADRLIGADWPGRMVRRIERERGNGFHAQFIQGACGDVNPMKPVGDRERAADEMAGVLASAALYGMEGAGAKPLSPRLRGASHRAVLPWRSHVDPADLLAEAETELERNPDDKASRAYAMSARHVAAAYRRGWWREGLRVPVQVESIGDLAIVGIGAEALTGTALAIAGKAGGATLVAGYTGADVGYLPPRAEYRFGGYEVDRAYRYYGYPNAFAPEAEEHVVATAVDLIRRLG